MRQPFEVDFLKSVANTLSTLIERRRVEESLREAKTQLEQLLAERTANLARIHSERELILDAIGEAVCGVDLRGTVTFINPAGAKQTGYAAAELIGKDFHGTLHHSRPDGTPYPREACSLCTANSRGERHSAAVERLWRKDGTAFPVEYLATPLRSSDALLGTVIVFRNIGERLAIEQQREDFVSTVSHELRTPLTSIRGSLGLLEAGVVGKLPEDAQKMVHIARSSTDRLIRLVGDILDLEKLGAGRVEIVAEEVAPLDVIALTLEGVEALAREAGVEIVEKARGQLPPIRGERDRLVQVLTNLVANAIKYSPSGSRVIIACDAPTNGDVRFEVSDEGPGIPAGLRDKLFRKFMQLGPPQNPRRQPGSGLGLAISRAIVELHAGTIGVDSQSGRGSTFFFTIPTA